MMDIYEQYGLGATVLIGIIGLFIIVKTKYTVMKEKLEKENIDE